MVFQTIQFYETALRELLKKALTVYEANEETLNSHLEGFMNFFSKDIAFHFKIETETVFPELRGEELVHELLKEYHEIMATFENLKVAKDVETKLNLLRKLMDLLLKHAENEDSNLLPLMKAKIPVKKLNEITAKAQRLQRDK